VIQAVEVEILPASSADAGRVSALSFEGKRDTQEAQFAGVVEPLGTILSTSCLRITPKSPADTDRGREQSAQQQERHKKPLGC
jgi:hypothetical protein